MRLELGRDRLPRPRQPGRDPVAAAEVGDALLVHEPPGPHDRHAVAGGLDFREHVRRKDHGAARRAGLANEREHLGPGRGVEIRRGLVENREGGIGGEHRGERELLPHARAHAGHLPRAIEIEPTGHLGGPVAPALGPQPGEEVERLEAVHAPKQPGLAGQIRRAGPDGERLGHAVEPRHAGRPARGMDKPEQQPQECGLARAIGAEQPEDLSLAHAERTAIERRKRAIPLREIDRFNEHQSGARIPTWRNNSRRG